MAANTPPYHLYLTIIEADRATAQVVQNMPDYTPRDPAHSAEALGRLVAQLAQAEQNKIAALDAFIAAHEALVQASQALHQASLGARAEIAQQFGDASHAVAVVGRVKRLERRRRVRRPQCHAPSEE